MKRQPPSTISAGSPEGENLLTKDQLAERLGLTRRGVECFVARKVIPVIRVGVRYVRFSWPAVQAALARYEIREVGR